MTKKILFLTGITLFTNIVHAAGYTTPPRARTIPCNQAPQKKTRRTSYDDALPRQIYNTPIPSAPNFTTPPATVTVVASTHRTYASALVSISTSRIRVREYPSNPRVGKKQKS